MIAEISIRLNKILKEHEKKLEQLEAKKGNAVDIVDCKVSIREIHGALLELNEMDEFDNNSQCIDCIRNRIFFFTGLDLYDY